ncbi:MAG: D-glycerate dehydrogenase [Phycisphaerales bacterium]|nr:D-glycerate dehydrogenase [Phycisphaerales bacterium]
MSRPHRIVILGRAFPQMPDLIRKAELGEAILLPEAPDVSPEQLRDAVTGAAGIVAMPHVPVGAELMDMAGESLRVISNHAVGLDNIDLQAAADRHIAVFNTPDPVCEPTADVAWLLMMGAARRVREGEQLIRDKQWTGFAADLLLGRRMIGRTLLIVGAGRIGAAVARRAVGWNMHVLYVANSDKPNLEGPPIHATRVELDAGLAEADFVSLHVPLTPETRHLINASRLALMKPTAVLVNTARGPIVDEEALINSLRKQEIFAAGLDVFDGEPSVRPEFLELPNVLALPHLGSATEEDRLWTTHLVVENLARVL